MSSFADIKEPAGQSLYGLPRRLFKWSEWRDLNPRPLGPEPSALPTALHPASSFRLLTRNNAMRYCFALRRTPPYPKKSLQANLFWEPYCFFSHLSMKPCLYIIASFKRKSKVLHALFYRTLPLLFLKVVFGRFLRRTQTQNLKTRL